jgi:hypothetical protein
MTALEGNANDGENTRPAKTRFLKWQLHQQALRRRFPKECNRQKKRRKAKHGNPHGRAEFRFLRFATKSDLLPNTLDMPTKMRHIPMLGRWNFEQL